MTSGLPERDMAGVGGDGNGAGDGLGMWVRLGGNGAAAGRSAGALLGAGASGEMLRLGASGEWLGVESDGSDGTMPTGSGGGFDDKADGIVTGESAWSAWVRSTIAGGTSSLRRGRLRAGGAGPSRGRDRVLGVNSAVSSSSVATEYILRFWEFLLLLEAPFLISSFDG